MPTRQTRAPLPKAQFFIVGYMNNTETNPNVPDPRNWQGSGNRSVTNMFIDLGMRVTMNDEQFQQKWPTGGRRSIWGRMTTLSDAAVSGAAGLTAGGFERTTGAQSDD